MPKEKRDQREWHMSPSERRMRGNSLRGDGSHVSPMEVTPKLGKGAPDTRRPPYHRVVAGLIKPAQCHDGSGGEAGGKPWQAGAYTDQRFKPLLLWEGPRKKAEVSNRTWEIRLYGITGGLLGNVAMVGM